jgi:hypothetical protein
VTAGAAEPATVVAHPASRTERPRAPHISAARKRRTPVPPQGRARESGRIAAQPKWVRESGVRRRCPRAPAGCGSCSGRPESPVPSWW